ncbi:GrpB family protein [Paenibacillus rigui]|uniref:GrpB family protein n=1 Tax=Paenibacillus rigui TaxID=554312 RepID=A0A229UH38_9BACL|nr:GrpB family protein [Paenibacillus rigui]OXM82702.1 hypothetical protein CF651_28945 [Paenibacillus rigui]
MADNTRVIEVVPYNPEWRMHFENMKEKLQNDLGDLILAVEHVGSTSVEGLYAKPIIDVDIVMESYDVLPAIIERLEDAGYVYEGNLGVEGREAFKAPEGSLVKHHLYECPKDGKGYLEHIAFRDYLRANEEARREYGLLKLRLAEQYRNDIDSYSLGKTAFVTSVLQRN